MNDTEQILEALKEPFPPEKVRWRIGKGGQGEEKPVLAYIDARDVMERLDDVVGTENWQDEYRETPSGRVLCQLGLCLNLPGDGETRPEWIYKSDGAGSTGFEGEKGGISDAFKRAAVKWGIGRYLYDVKAPWVVPLNNKPPPSFDGKRYLKGHAPDRLISHVAAVRDHWASIISIKANLEANELSYALEAYRELGEDVMKTLWVAPSRGGIFTTKERSQLDQAATEAFQQGVENE